MSPRALFLLLCLIPNLALAQSLGKTTDAWMGQSDEKELTFLAFFFSRSEVGNIFPENDLLRGQTVGRLFGNNSTTTSDEDKSLFTEQRILPFFIYKPRILDGFALLRASFELDWTWGDVSYGAGGNLGGAFSADQVNLQTQNLEIELRFNRNWYLEFGLQRLYDNPRDLYRTFFSTLTHTGQRLAFWGSDATGIVLHGKTGRQKYKLGAYQLYENNIQEDDDVVLFEAALDQYLRGTWHIGASARYVRDRANGEGGVSVLSQGLNSSLTDYNGVFRFDFGSTAYHADIAWFGLDSSVNPEFASGRFGGSAFLVANAGQVRTETSEDSEEYEEAARIFGLAADMRLGYRYGIENEDYVSAELLYTSGDENALDDDLYSGVITGNTWGSPGAAYTSSGLYLLMPHLFVVNRYYGVVSDISNMGYGLSCGVLNVSRELIRNRLRAKIGGGSAYANVASDGGGKHMGWEVNGMLTYQPKAFFTLGLHAARMNPGDFFDSNNFSEDGRPVPGWTVFGTLSWLMF